MASGFRRKSRTASLWLPPLGGSQGHWRTKCSGSSMAHPYPPHMDKFSYVGKYRYFVTFCTYERQVHFTEAEPVNLVQRQILRATQQQQFLCTAYFRCFVKGAFRLKAEAT